MTDDEITDLLFFRDPPGRSDLAMVFGSHEPTLAVERARHAASLYRSGLTPRLLFTGGPTGNGSLVEAEAMAAVAAEDGVPPEAMLLEVESRTTVENFTFSVALLRKLCLLDSLRVLHLVSCPWHMRRVGLHARTAFGPAVRLLASPHEGSCTASSWPASPECRRWIAVELRLVRGLLDNRS
ncbi:MAG TPA: YdcF family protein [Gemmataceae bacterium]|jgi:uncharacterized SAM-binding protein YcdF (DUF218 family)